MKWLLLLLFACKPDPPPEPTFMYVKGKLTWDDVHEIEKELPPAAPYLHKSAQLVSEDANWMSMVIGTTPDYIAIRKLAVASGRMFTDADTFKVVVLGDRLVEALHAQVGGTIRIDSQPFEVIGVLAHQGMAETGQDRDDLALVPVEIFDKKLRRGARAFDGTMFVANPARMAELRELLHTRHLGVDDFTISATPVP